MRSNIFISALLITALVAGTSIALNANSDPIIVRVLIMDDKDSVYLSVKDAYKIYAANSD